MEPDEVARFGATFEQFMRTVLESATPRQTAASLAARVDDFLGTLESLPIVTESFRAFEHPTVQVALDAMLAADGTTHELVGIGGGGREHTSFAEMLEMSRQHSAFSVGAVDHSTVPVSADDELTCVAMGVYLIDEAGGRLAVLLRGGSQHGQGPALEVVSPSVQRSRAWLQRLRAERAARNLLRGQVLSFEPNPFEPGIGPVRFHRRPQVTREQVVMAGDILDRLERQVAGVARHRERLLREGRHLKRGVLMYGPPGTGKTHTVRWLTSGLADFTVLLLTGPSIRFVAEASALARVLQPSLIVLEDVDLVAEDRDFSEGSNPLLFTVLDQMDGLAADADVAFLLTTNRVDVLEPALAQRPGRVDLSVEVPLPDEDGRRRLLALYGGDLELDEDEAAQVVALTEGVPASFVKELVRRATLIAAEQDAGTTTGRHVMAAAAELVQAQEELTRRMLGGVRERGTGYGPSDGQQGAGGDDGADGGDGGDVRLQVDEPGSSGAYGSRLSTGRAGWFTYAPLPERPPPR